MISVLRVAAGLALAALLSGCATSDHLYLLRRDVTCSPFAGPVAIATRPHGAP